jgi:TRAP-type C4-dicarboxylate transport system permease large subunit
MAGLLPAGLMAAALIAVVVLFGGRNVPDTAAMQHDIPLRRRWGGARSHAGPDRHHLRRLPLRLRRGHRNIGLRRALRIVGGGLVFREFTPCATAQVFMHAARRSGLVLFIVAAAQAMAFVLTSSRFRMRWAT